MGQNRDNCAVYTPEQLRQAEETAMSECAIPQALLMEHAAIAVADAVCRDVSVSDADGVRVALLAGSGNNGADALATARLLVRRGFCVTVYELKRDREEDDGNRRTWMFYSIDHNAYPRWRGR